jgi:toxin ParE1/3/4
MTTAHPELRRMTDRVELTAAAECDIQRIVEYIALHALPARAMHGLDAIEAQIDGLATELTRGSYPQELSALGIRDFREVFFKPYRILYRIFEEEQVLRVFVIADGRRSLQRLLEQRLLGA